MNSRMVLLDLIAIFLLLALVGAASAQTRTVGVSVGNKFRYNITVSWSSTDPSAIPPSNIAEANDTQWSDFTVTGISGTNITTQITTHLKNNTDMTGSGWKDVNTGSGNLSMFFISANLNAGDLVYTSSSYKINETVSRTYSGVQRDTNHFNMASPAIGTQNLYWDKSTGVLVELLMEMTYNTTGAYTATWSMGYQIVSSDLWVVPEFPTWTPLLFILISVTSATIVNARQKRPLR
jgi:hypothetical protein